jgi:hypothetical protein
MTETVIIG